MSARDNLLVYLRQAGLSTPRAEANLDAFAHELAQRIREERDGLDPFSGMDAPTVISALSRAASLIDPSASPVRPVGGSAPGLRLVTGDVCTATLQGWPIEVVDECVRKAGHYNEDDPDSWHQSEVEPGGTRRMWADSANGATPHRTGPARPDEKPTT
jgi:sirohydrochlorin ferrochelatase